jgi:hypothetical protein
MTEQERHYLTDTPTSFLANKANTMNSGLVFCACDCPENSAGNVCSATRRDFFALLLINSHLTADVAEKDRDNEKSGKADNDQIVHMLSLLLIWR